MRTPTRAGFRARALVGSGDLAYVVADDFNGTLREGIADVGAYEFSADGNVGWPLDEDFKGEVGGGRVDGGFVGAVDGGPGGGGNGGGCGCSAAAACRSRVVCDARA